ncbi:MAG: hypothetical protein HY519_01590 [Candidatus Aenigmarchaeota archaeon]|nr:hypothetical protein [Candidatus Aenigmarchaeota archaeon]
MPAATDRFMLFLLPFLAASAGVARGQQSLPDPVSTIGTVSFLSILIIAISIALKERLGEQLKKVFFIVIAATVSLSTIYLGWATVTGNMASATQGPVHWHADFEIWVCGQSVQLPGPTNLENRVGTPLLHHHNEGSPAGRPGVYRIHVEGVVKELQDVSLGRFFEAIGGSLTKTAIGIPQADGSMAVYRNGDACPDGSVGALGVYVNNQLSQAMDGYVIQPYSNVPPGDYIKIVFGGRDYG